MKKTAQADVVIFGGGITGMWLLNTLRQLGLSALLFESGAIGGGQTIKAQGIIHGGMKYALKGLFGKEAQELLDMPSVWRECLSGRGDIDLSRVPILSAKHFVWAPNKLFAKIGGFLASATLSSKVESLPREQYPTLFQLPDFRGEVFALDEIVIDVPSLVRELLQHNQDAIFHIEPLAPDALHFQDDKLTSTTVYSAGKPIEITAQYFVFAAGIGNEVIINKLENPTIAMQRRPLHMVMVKTPFDYPLYAHCLGMGPRPRITITTHYTQDGEPIWYLGGQLAEDGINKSKESQIKAAREELQSLFPWLNFNGAEYAAFLIDRAEPQQENGLKPTSAYFKAIHNVLISWPTKMALTPKLVADIKQFFLQEQVIPRYLDLRELRAWPMPPMAAPVWEEAFCKSVA